MSPDIAEFNAVGSGTTVAVAVRLGRQAVGIDQSPVACGIARARLIATLLPGAEPVEGGAASVDLPSPAPP